MNFKSTGICSHTVAVAHLNGKLESFVKFLSKSKKIVNFSKVSLHKTPSGSGKKGSQAPRKRKQAQPVTERIPFSPGSHSNHDASPSTASTSSIPAYSAPAYDDTSSHYLSSFCHSDAYASSFHHSVTPWSSGHFPSSYNHQVILPQSTSTFNSFNNASINFSPVATTTYNMPSLPQSPQEYEPFKLWFISGNISRCVGCGNKFVKPAAPPFDLCVQHKEWRSFTPKGQDEQKSKYSNAYYHLNLSCIRRNWEHFCHQDLVILPEVEQKLTDSHKNFLQQVFVITH
uniref:Uncharacterized protein n=1 Tax=Amphimedon queenslandica TaxID=400682 RepID=A0A1X7TIK4_AMPQE